MAEAKLDADISAWFAQCEERVQKLDEAGDEGEYCVVCDKVAKKNSKFIRCKKCNEASFCSKECLAKGQSSKAHDGDVCKQLSLYADAAQLIQDENLQEGEPHWLAYSDVPAGTKLVKSWQAYGTTRGVPGSDIVPYMAVVTHALTFPMTLLLALDRVLQQNLDKKKELTVHILGVEETAEGNFPEKWMEVLHWLPNLERLDLVMVGPEIPDANDNETFECDTVIGEGDQKLADEEDEEKEKAKVKDQGKDKKSKDEKANKMKADDEDKETEAIGVPRPYTVTYSKQLYHDFMQSNPDTPKPDLAIAFNAGLADFAQEWKPTIDLLLERNIPFAVTSFHEREADFDLRILQHKFGAKFVGNAPQTKNPFRSLFPIPDPIYPNRLFYLNQFISVVKGKAVEGGEEKEQGKKKRPLEDGDNEKADKEEPNPKRPRKE